MTDQPLTDDELLSSHLDGQLDAAEDREVVARLERDPALAARLAELKRASELAATPVTPLGAADTDRLIAAALAQSATSGDVIDLTAAATSRRVVWAQRVAIAAASVLVVAVGVGVLANLDSDDGTETADAGSAATTATEDVDESLDGGADTADDPLTESDLFVESGDGAEGGTAEEMQDEAALDAAGAAPPVAFEQFNLTGFDVVPDELGIFASALELGDDADERFRAYRDDAADPTGGSGETATTTTVEEPESADEDPTERSTLAAPCEGVLAAELGDADLLDVARATIAGQDVVIGVASSGGADALLVVVDAGTCSVLASRTLG